IGIDCPLMIVKGDGTLALAERVALRPIETVLSGPAASLVGASWLSGLRDFIMSDMGGTTTDLGVLLDGRPQVAEQGAEVGGWRTMVKAI
ncbi:hydantoinase/oxoprolinase family protein, partial [Citrobacter sp. AAK_AS5]